jgi:hypothetical protein
VFHEKILYGQIVDKAISFQTMISPDPRNVPDGTWSYYIPSYLINSSLFSFTQCL